MASGVRRLIGPGVAYIVFGGFMLYLGLCGWGIIPCKDFPKGTFMAVISTALGVFDLVMGVRRLLSWGGACPYCGYSKVNLFRDAKAVYCRLCKKEILRKGSFIYRKDES